MQETPSFDTWTSGFLIAAAMGLFLFVMILTGSSKRNRPIAFFILAFSLILFQYVLYWTRYEEVFPYLQLLPSVCYFASGPLFYLYFLNLYKKEVRFNYALHFLPALVLVIPTVIVALKYMGVTEMAIPFLWLASKFWIVASHMAVYSLLIYILIKRSREQPSQYMMLRKRWSNLLLGLYVVFIMAYVSYFILVQFPFFNDQWDYMISIMMSVSIYTIGYVVFKQPAIFNGELFSQLFLPSPNKDESFEDSLLNEFYQSVTRYMEQEKPYIDNELRLVHLADQLGFSVHLLSKVINKKSGMNFNKFVNEYRLREAERLLAEEANSSIKSVYFDVGFNSKATFYNAFRKKHNCTPSEFRTNSLGLS